MSKSKPLTAAQQLVLTTAAQRPDRLVLPLPPELPMRGGARQKLLATLLKRELLEEFPVSDANVAWRTDEGDQPLGLRLTSAGLAAAGIPESASSTPSAAVAASEAAVSASVANKPAAAGPLVAEPGLPSPTGKLGQVLQAISAEPGATLAEITTLTSWLPHTARAAVTGLRQRGFTIRLLERNGRKAYHRVEAG